MRTVDPINDLIPVSNLYQAISELQRAVHQETYKKAEGRMTTGKKEYERFYEDQGLGRVIGSLNSKTPLSTEEQDLLALGRFIQQNRDKLIEVLPDTDNQTRIRYHVLRRLPQTNMLRKALLAFLKPVGLGE